MAQRSLFLALYAVLVICTAAQDQKNGTDLREDKQFSLFSVIRFPNGVCSGGSGTNGTCYTAEECEERDGKNSGTCAEGFGVCCTFSFEGEDGCGSTVMENNTKLMFSASTSTTTSLCQYKICKASNDICRIKLQFNTFNLASPITGTVVVGVSNVKAADGLNIGNCAVDSFSVSAPGSMGSPQICGFNTGQHMIIDASDACNLATFSLSGSSARQWDITVLQYSCGPSSPGGPTGCLQYYTGDVGTISSYNFPSSSTIGDSVTHLSNQNYQICIRKEINMCSICYVPSVRPNAPATAIQASFGLSVSPTIATTAVSAIGTNCLSDYVVIPLSQNKDGDGAFTMVPAPGRICGRIFSSVDSQDAIAAYDPSISTNNISVCSSSVPFIVRFVSDFGEATADGAGTTATDELSEASGGNVGFSLNYVQQACA